MIVPGDLSRHDRYRLLIGCVVPRPIAWVATCDAGGSGNLAPFSAFQIVTAHPLTVSLAIAWRAPAKDTLANLRATGEAVIHLVPEGLLDAMHASSAEHPPGVDEAALLGLARLPSARVRPQRLAGAEVALECSLEREIPVGDPPTALCLLEVVAAHIDPAVAAADGLPDPERFRPCARLGGDQYLLPGTWTRRALPRPRRPSPDGPAAQA